MSETERIKSILEHLVGHFAYKDDEGNWWGHDTNLGSRTANFTAAINSIRGQDTYKRQKKVKLKYYKELTLKRDALAKAIWGKNVPLWWKGSRGEWQVLESITEVTASHTQPKNIKGE